MHCGEMIGTSKKDKALKLNRYEGAIVGVWRRQIKKQKSLDHIKFTKEDLVREMKVLQKKYGKQQNDVKNVPDIIYTFRARADLPKEISKNGNYAIIGRGKGQYSFVKIKNQNRLRIPLKITQEKVQQKIPKWILKYMSDDEQGMLTNINQNEIIKRFLNLKSAFRLQSHLRMGVPSYGQIEIDELYFCEDKKSNYLICAVEAKDKSDQDLFNISQLFGVAKALQSKYPTLPKRIVCTKPGNKNEIIMCEINASQNVEEIKQISEWKSYVIE